MWEDVFESSHGKEVTICEQNHHNQTWSAGSCVDFNPKFNFYFTSEWSEWDMCNSLNKTR